MGFLGQSCIFDDIPVFKQLFKSLTYEYCKGEEIRYFYGKQLPNLQALVLQLHTFLLTIDIGSEVL